MNVCLTGKKPSFNTAKKIAAVAAVSVAATAVGVLAAPVIAGAALGAAGFTSAGVHGCWFCRSRSAVSC